MLSDRLTYPEDERDGTPGEGRGSHVAELAAALAARGHELRLYVRDTGGRPPAGGVPVELVPAGPRTELADAAAVSHVGDVGRWLAERWSGGGFRPDVVHGHYWLAGLAALTATADSGLPVVVTFHGLAPAVGSTPATRPGLERALGRYADRIVALRAAEADQLARLGISRSSIVVVPSGVDLERFTPSGPATPRSGDLSRVLVLGPDGHPDLIRALRSIPDVELVLVAGRERDRERDRALAEAAGVADRVAVLGSVPGADLPGWYRSADLACCPARSTPAAEPVPTDVAALEAMALGAMACGVPIVGYAEEGLAEWLVDGVTGDLVPPGDLRRLVQVLRDLLADQARRLSYASAAVDRVQARYTWDRSAAALEREYARLTGVELAVEEVAQASS
jgi:D-inositol-3-phosphate glycosyltransferase